jgi:hypothetical protein
MLTARQLGLSSILVTALSIGATASVLACHPGGPKNPWTGVQVQHPKNYTAEQMAALALQNKLVPCKYAGTETHTATTDAVPQPTSPHKTRSGKSKKLAKKPAAAEPLPGDMKKKPTRGVGFHEVDKPATRSPSAVGFNPQPDPLLGGGVIDPNQISGSGTPGAGRTGRTGR